MERTPADKTCVGGGALGADPIWQKKGDFRIYFEKGGLCEAYAEKVGSSRAAQTENVGSFGAAQADKRWALPRQILILA